MVKYKNFEISEKERNLVIEIISRVKNFLFENPGADIPAIYSYLLGNDAEMRRFRNRWGSTFSQAFGKFNQLLLMRIPNLLEKLPYLPAQFFIFTSVERIDIPKNIKYIQAGEYCSDSPFTGCNGLEVINYLGTREEWDELASKSYQLSKWWNYIKTDYQWAQDVNLYDTGIVNCVGK